VGAVNDLVVEGLVVRRGAFVLGPVDLSVTGGSATVILGPSGAGKTTLLRTLAGFLPAAAGSVRLGAESLDGRPPERRRLGFVPPNLGLFPHRRVRENVAYPLRLAGVPDASERTAEWLSKFDLEELADRYPAEVSSGERHRVAMARALAAAPRALLWDEPLAALDVETRDGLLRLLRELLEQEEIPLLLVTHDPATAAAVASRFALLEGGRLCYEGPPHRMVEGRLDRFTARFLGLENLFAPADLAHPMVGSVAAALTRAGGPDGLAVPGDALRWGPGTEGTTTAHVAAVHWSPAGWVVALREGPLIFRVAAGARMPDVRVGEVVPFAVDVERTRPLGPTYGEVPP
jgi:molybdate transport system ATP-binding protein